MNTGSALARFTITLSQAVIEPVQVEWFTSDGTAKAAVDYAANKGTVVFAPGETAKTVDILVYGRAVGTEDRSFFVEMLPPTNAILGAAIGECVIHVDTTGSVPVTQIIVPTGPQGVQGKSAYQSYLDTTTDVPPMTEEQWLESLKGDPQEIAEAVAPLIDVGATVLTAEGTETLGHPDATTVKAVARRVAYAAGAKIATTVLADGDNTLSDTDISGDAVDFAGAGFVPKILRAGAFFNAQWKLNQDGTITIYGATAGDILYAVQYDFVSDYNSRSSVLAASLDAIELELSGPDAALAGVVTRGHLLSNLVLDDSLEVGQSYRCTDRADGIFDVVSSVTYPPNGYTTVLVTAKSSLCLKLRVSGNIIDLEQAGGKPYIPGSQEVDCKQALIECFYLLLNEESATVDLKSKKWLLSSYEFNTVKQRRKIKGNNAVIYGMVDDGVTNRDYLISTAWNYQDIEGVVLDLQFNPRYACALRITHGYGRYSDITIRKSRCMIQVGIPDTNPVSLSEFMFHNLRGEENAKIAVVHGLYSVLNISDSIVPCGEGTFWKSYDCTGFTVYGGRVFLLKSGGNSNVITNDNPYVYLANAMVGGTPYIGSFNADQCDFEIRTRFCIVQDTSTTYQDYQQSVVVANSRLAVYSSLDARAKLLFQSTVGYRGSLRIKNTDVHFDTAITVPPINAGGHTIVDIDYDSFYVPGLRGPKVVSWAGYPPMMKQGVYFQSNIGADVPVSSGSIFVPFPNPIVALDGDTALLSYQYDAVTKKFNVPVSGISNVVATVRLTLKTAASAPVSVLIEVNNGSGGIGIARGVIPAGQTGIVLSGAIRELPSGYQVYVITDSTGAYTLSNTGAYDSCLTIACSILPPHVRT